MPPGTRHEPIPVPAGTRFPIEIEPPPGFMPGDPAAWPHDPGRFEWVDGRLRYMPPCGHVQRAVAISVAGILDRWLDDHPVFSVGGNEAGMLLGEDVRGADAAVWRREAVPPVRGAGGEFARVPPLLAVEIEGRDERERDLRAKAAWYLARGVQVVWLVLTGTREVIVVTEAGDTRHGVGETLPIHAALPDLRPAVARFFRQLD